MYLQNQGHFSVFCSWVKLEHPNFPPELKIVLIFNCENSFFGDPPPPLPPLDTPLTPPWTAPWTQPWTMHTFLDTTLDSPFDTALHKTLDTSFGTTFDKPLETYLGTPLETKKLKPPFRKRRILH